MCMIPILYETFAMSIELHVAVRYVQYQHHYGHPGDYTSENGKSLMLGYKVHQTDRIPFSPL